MHELNITSFTMITKSHFKRVIIMKNAVPVLLNNEKCCFAGLIIRFLGGEKLVNLPPLVHFPGYEPPSEEEVRVLKETVSRDFCVLF
jgi:hypothetical protein